MGRIGAQIVPVAIVGGGPVGLFLAACLGQFGIECRVLEKRAGISGASRSIGIHGVSLGLFARLDLSEALLASGIRITRGVALDEYGKLGELNLEACLSDRAFVLIVPQNRTESILYSHVCQSYPGFLQGPTEVVGLRQMTNHVEILCRDSLSCSCIVRARIVVACDGKRSVVRRSAGIAFVGGCYPDSFIMGDFADNTCFGPVAAIYLPSEGLIESFPLPGGNRRWVARLDEPVSIAEVPATRAELEDVVRKRIGHELQDCDNYMMSRFRAERYLAATLLSDRIVLAGDAAHVISPIGGQGLNLGWLGAWRLAEQISAILHKRVDHREAFSVYDRQQRKAARRAARRAELNMKLGRKYQSVSIRNALVRVLLQAPVNRLTARLFTMHGLYSWPV
mgnify:CR=1 FL=1